MTQETDKPKTLSLKKPLSLTKEVEIATLFNPPKKELKKPKVNEFFKPGIRTFYIAQGQDQTQMSNKFKSQQEKGKRKHKPKKHIFNGLSVAKDRSTTKGKKHKQVPTKLSTQEAKAVWRITLRKSEEKQTRRKQEALTWLRERFPACFTLDPPQPLKVSIYIVYIMK